jgi:WD40 repeat protein
MQERLTVKDFYKAPTLASAIEIDNLHKTFFVREWLFVTTKDAPIVLQQYSLKSKSKEKEYLLPFEDIAGVDILGSTITLFFNNNEDLWVCLGDKVVGIKSHFIPITALIAHRGNLYTGSADMTIRIWNPRNGTLVQDPKLHALSAHTGAVNFFLSVEEYLMSASSDKTVIVWRGTNIHTKKTFPSEVVMIADCA